MSMALLLFVSAFVAGVVSMYGILDAWLTVQALKRDPEWSDDSNAQLLANGGIRTAALRTWQMLEILYVGTVAMTIQPRPAVAAAVSVVWFALARACWLSAAKELLAIRDRRRIKPEPTP
jgi:hypothetical protein